MERTHVRIRGGWNDASMDSTLRGRQVTLRPLAPEDTPRLRAIRSRPEVRRWWFPPENDFPAADEPEAVRFAVEHDGAVVGMIQYAEEEEPDYRHAGIDVFLDPAVHRRGLGADAVLTLAVHLIRDRGHHRLTIDPAAANAAAIACYRAAGFRPVGVLRAYERDRASGEWHDGLLMDALADEIVAAAERRGVPV
jgi:aminoglycoside 6'-N-acetyltransferase